MAQRESQIPQVLSRCWQWMTVSLIILFVVFVRVRLREMPLERDEGEYAYAGQLMLQGIPPYQLAYNMKLPGTYAAYALIMAVFGQTTSGIHLGLTVVNVATILLVFLLGRKLLDGIAGTVGAVTYGLLSTSPSFLGTAAHATHFVVLCALGGALLLLHACERGRGWLFFFSGLCFGLAFLMKQHGIFFGVFALAYVLWHNWSSGRMISRKCLAETGLLCAGLAFPFLLTCAVLWRAGVFGQFVFWTITYAGEYASAVALSQLHEVLRAAVDVSVSLNLLFWIVSGVGALMMWWEKRLRPALPFLLGLLVAGVLALSAGMYFRQHYFILLLPVLALLNGVAVSRAIYLIRHEKSVELFLALAVMVVFGLGLISAPIVHGDVWFAADPNKASRAVYGTSLFADTVGVADYIREHSSPEARIAVLGSEPQIYFHARRHSATGYIYTYPLMERHAHALRMQEEMISEIERARPEYLVFVQDKYSWLQRENSEEKIFKWWDGYWAAGYELIKTINIAEERAVDTKPDNLWDGAPRPAGGYLLLLKRKSLASNAPVQITLPMR